MDLLQQEKQITDRALAKFFSDQLVTAKKIDPELVSLTQEIALLATRGGKKTRSILTRIAYSLLGQDVTQAVVEASLFVELSHLFLLVHDDIADKDFVRYSGHTLEKVFESKFQKRFSSHPDRLPLSMAMVSGDLIWVMAHELLSKSKLKPKVKSRVELIMSQTLKQVVTGWAMHQWQNHLSIEEVTSNQYLKGMRLVSGSYTFNGPLQVGLAVAENFDSRISSSLEAYADNAGIAFQIRDDILGVFGDPAKTGKPVGNDLREGKKTLLVLEAFSRGGESTKKLISTNLSSDLNTTQVEQIKQAIIDTGSLEASEKKAQEHVEIAIRALDQLKGLANETALNKLRTIAQLANNRDH